MASLKKKIQNSQKFYFPSQRHTEPAHPSKEHQFRI